MKLFKLKSLSNFSNEKKVVAKNYFALVVLQGLNYLLPLIIIPFLQRKLGTETFGLVMFAQALMVFCVLITEYGFNTTATREIAILKENKQDFSNVYFNVFWARVFLLLVVFIILVTIVFLFDKFSKNWELYLLSYGLVVGQAIFPVWFFQGIEKMRLITIINVIAKVIFTLLIVIFITSTKDFLKVPLFNSIGFLIAGMISFVISLKYVKWKKTNFKEAKAFYYESTQVFIANISSSLYTALNTFLLGIFGSDMLVGIYSSFEKLILAAKNMFVPIYQAIYPYLSRKTKVESQILMKKLIVAISIIGLMLTGVFVFFAESILRILYNDSLIISHAYLFKIMSLIALFSGLNMLYNVLYAPAQKKFKTVMLITLIVGVFNAILSIIIVPIFKIEGTVCAVVLSEFLLLILASYCYSKDLKENSLIKI